MKPILFNRNTTDFTGNGVCRLAEAVECKVTEQRNGSFELEMSYPVGGVHYEDIATGMIIFATHDDSRIPQPFDIYKCVKPNAGLIKVYARHIAYRLSNYVMKSVVLASGLSEKNDCNTALQDMKAAIIGSCDFSFYSDITLNAAPSKIFTTEEFSTPWSMFSSDDENTIMSVYGGEVKLDKFKVSLLANRGSYKGVKIRRGKNMKSMTATTSTDEVITSVAPYWNGFTKEGEETHVALYTQKLIDNPSAKLTDEDFIMYTPDHDDYDREFTLSLDLSEAFEEVPTSDELRKATDEYIRRYLMNTRDNINYSIDVLAYSNDDLNHIMLCDEVLVQDDIIGVNRKMKVVSTTYDVLNDRYTKIEVGALKKSLSYSMQYKNVKEEAQSAIAISTATTDATTTRYRSYTNTDLLSRANATQLKSLAAKLANISNSGGVTGGGTTFDGNIGGQANKYGTLKQYGRDDVAKMLLDNDGFKGQVAVMPSTDIATDTETDLFKVSKTNGLFGSGTVDSELIKATYKKGATTADDERKVSILGDMIKASDAVDEGERVSVGKLDGLVNIDGTVLVGDINDSNLTDFDRDPSQCGRQVIVTAPIDLRTGVSLNSSNIGYLKEGPTIYEYEYNDVWDELQVGRSGKLYIDDDGFLRVTKEWI